MQRAGLRDRSPIYRSRLGTNAYQDERDIYPHLLDEDTSADLKKFRWHH
jgi:hypothetical protein